jgi:CRISPR-associated protein Csm1
MDETVYKIAMAGFFHDIGKFADKEVLGLSQQYIDNHSRIYLPLFNKHYSHFHAVYTAAFIEQMKDTLPKEFNRPEWGEGDSFINLAAGHHNPETPMQWIITIADRISSGWDRAEFDEEYNKTVTQQNYKKNRLLPIFEHLSAESEKLAETSENYNYCYPLKPISPGDIFPRLKNEICTNDNEVALRDYQELFSSFVEELKGLFHRQENKALWFEHFESLAMKYTSAIPSVRVGHVIPDVSLYDHLKLTSAIASAIYLFHKQTGSMAISDIKDEDRKKFLVISGDFYGIQNFIFSSGDIQKNRSKMLRGRSFAVSLFSELAADMLCRGIGLPSVSVIMNAAGKFSLIAPNTEESKKVVNTVERKVNDWLVKVAFGETAMGISYVEAASKDFLKGHFVKIWSDLHTRMDKKRFQKIDLSQYAGSISDYLDSFHNNLEHPLCPFCGKRPSNPKAENSHFVGEKASSCALCRDHIFLGENLVKNIHLAITVKEANIKGGDNQKLIEPIFGEYQVAFLDGGLKDIAQSGALLKYWDVSNNSNDKRPVNVTARFINGYVPIYTQEDLKDDRLYWGKKDEGENLDQTKQIELGIPKTFGHIASKALNAKGDKYAGVEALGVLKADVDNLGLLVDCGLKGELFTLSRLATLSRQLNHYFTIYLPYLLMSEPEFNNVYTVFAGGDDLFLVGPWNHIIQLSEKIRATFGEYTCKNPNIHLSAGITLHKPNTPVSFMADLVELSLEAGKEGGRNRLTVFSETVLWDEMARLTLIQKELEMWLERRWINTAMLFRMNHIMKMAEDEKLLVKDNEIFLEDMECTKWRALLSYTVGRNAAKEINVEERATVVDHIRETLNKWLLEYGSKLKIPVWNILYDQRAL